MAVFRVEGGVSIIATHKPHLLEVDLPISVNDIVGREAFTIAEILDFIGEDECKKHFNLTSDKN